MYEQFQNKRITVRRTWGKQKGLNDHKNSKSKKNLRATHKVRDCLEQTVKQSQTELRILQLM